MHSSLWLSVLIVLPLVGALAAMLVRKTPGASYAVAVGTGVIEVALSLVVAVLYQSNIAGAQGFDFYSRHVVSAPLGLAYDIALDGLSLLMVVLTALVLLLSLLGGRDKRREPAFVSWLLILTGLTMGSFVAHDVLEFFVFFELTLVPCYFIISGWGGAERARAALKFFLYTFTASAFLLIGILYMGFAYQHQHPALGLTFAYGAMAATSMSHATAVWLFVAFALAFGAKAPIWPLHTWSPLTYAEAPTAG
ncbi:MAG TPA: proton-conducting transporter membrane subunit, partial [Acidimicrobiales bacterium]